MEPLIHSPQTMACKSVKVRTVPTSSSWAPANVSKPRTGAHHVILSAGKRVEAENRTHHVILSAGKRVEAENRPAKDLASANGRDDLGAETHSALRAARTSVSPSRP